MAGLTLKEHHPHRVLPRRRFVGVNLSAHQTAQQDKSLLHVRLREICAPAIELSKSAEDDRASEYRYPRFGVDDFSEAFSPSSSVRKHCDLRTPSQEINVRLCPLCSKLLV